MSLLKFTAQPLFSLWMLTGLGVALLCALPFLTHLTGDYKPTPLPLEDLIVWRTVCYISVILLLPLTNLLRYVFLRLNQTMPALAPIIDIDALAKQRYLCTVSVSLGVMMIIGSFGAIMYILGDSVNTLYILTLVAGLGVFLYRPKLDEYHAIVHALTLMEKTR